MSPLARLGGNGPEVSSAEIEEDLKAFDDLADTCQLKSRKIRSKLDDTEDLKLSINNTIHQFENLDEGIVLEHTVKQAKKM